MCWNCYLCLVSIMHGYSLLLQSYDTGFGSKACHIGNVSINMLRSYGFYSAHLQETKPLTIASRHSHGDIEDADLLVPNTFR